MLVKAVKTERYQDYKYPCMFIACHSCSFKCDKECRMRVCQNSALAKSPDIEVSTDYLIDKYINNPITRAVVFGGLEPFDDINDVIAVISKLREIGIEDDVVIYTGYTKAEVIEEYKDAYKKLSSYQNIIIKYGRYIPNKSKHYDEVLGVYLSSTNQYAERLE